MDKGHSDIAIHFPDFPLRVVPQLVVKGIVVGPADIVLLLEQSPLKYRIRMVRQEH